MPARLIPAPLGEPADAPRFSPDAAAARARETARQAALLAGIWRPTEPSAPAQVAWWRGAAAEQARGLMAYRDNAAAIVVRALRAAYPTVDAVLGDEAFAALARAFGREHPPTCGDLAHYGRGFGRTLAGAHGLEALPYLPDVAELDWAVHVVEAAADPGDQVIDLERLAADDPSQLGLRLAPAVACIACAWPVVSIWQAHHTERARLPAPPRFAAVNEALAAGTGECALVWRDGWRPGVVALDPADAAFTLAVQAGHSVAAALERAGADFAFDAWLLRAVQQQWLQAVVRLPVFHPGTAPQGARTS